ncbi:unnamed protein product [Eruca vesicaria subsp. sativa]|uniref:Uncharacterized protein n=1 Tax=Eruca vesicaria subsp. sativa TaxID=29727 RepID=A0ABC8K1G3_ERUVS|nr:unnamed protein product [Eruca vesicaria subsp. sativa]
MEGKGKAGSSSSSSSITAQLSGPKERSCSSNFKSIFPPPSKGTSGNILSSKNGSIDHRKESSTCNLSSSLYYGGQDVYSGSTSSHTYHNVNKAQPRGDDDASGNNSTDASRGNWWKGIFSLINNYLCCNPCLTFFPSNMPRISSILQVRFIIKTSMQKYQQHQVETELFPSYRPLFNLFERSCIIQ